MATRTHNLATSLWICSLSRHPVCQWAAGEADSAGRVRARAGQELWHRKPSVIRWRWVNLTFNSQNTVTSAKHADLGLEQVERRSIMSKFRRLSCSQRLAVAKHHTDTFSTTSDLPWTQTQSTKNKGKNAVKISAKLSEQKEEKVWEGQWKS